MKGREKYSPRTGSSSRPSLRISTGDLVSAAEDARFGGRIIVTYGKRRFSRDGCFQRWGELTAELLLSFDGETREAMITNDMTMRLGVGKL